MAAGRLKKPEKINRRTRAVRTPPRVARYYTLQLHTDELGKRK